MGTTGSTGDMQTSQMWPGITIHHGAEYIVCWCDNSTSGCVRDAPREPRLLPDQIPLFSKCTMHRQFDTMLQSESNLVA